MNTRFTSNTGLGAATFGGMKTVDEQGNLTGKTDDLNMALFAQNFNLEVAPSRSFSFSLGGTGMLMAGTSEDAALLIGANAGYSYSLGVRGRLLRSKRFLLSVVGSFVSGAQYSLSPLGALVSTLVEKKINKETLFSESQSQDLGASLHAAFSATRKLGIQTTLSYTGGDKDEKSFGLGADLDLQPVGVGASFGWREDVEEKDSGAQLSLSGGVMYTGRDDLALGLWISRVTQDIEGIDGLEMILGNVTFSYFW